MSGILQWTNWKQSSMHSSAPLSESFGSHHSHLTALKKIIAENSSGAECIVLCSTENACYADALQQFPLSSTEPRFHDFSTSHNTSKVQVVNACFVLVDVMVVEVVVVVVEVVVVVVVVAAAAIVVR